MDPIRRKLREIHADERLQHAQTLLSAGVPWSVVAYTVGVSSSELSRLLTPEIYANHLDYKKKWNRRQTEMSNKVAEQLLAAIAELSAEIRRLRAAIK